MIGEIVKNGNQDGSILFSVKSSDCKSLDFMLVLI